VYRVQLLYPNNQLRLVAYQPNTSSPPPSSSHYVPIPSKSANNNTTPSIDEASIEPATESHPSAWLEPATTAGPSTFQPATPDTLPLTFDTEQEDDNDSAYGAPTDYSETSSLASSIMKYRVEMGRTYHVYGAISSLCSHT
jgi:hypothetical protein